MSAVYSTAIAWFRVTDTIVIGDKTLALTPAIINEADVGAIVAIMPTINDFSKAAPELVAAGVPLCVLTYDRTKSSLDLCQFEEAAVRIETILNTSQQKTLMIVCNTGFQRSIPFLAWYLIYYCKMHEMTVEKVIDMTMPQYDMDGYKIEEMRKIIIDNVTQLLKSPRTPG